MKKFKNFKNNDYYIYGKHSAIASLENKNRIIKKIYLTNENYKHFYDLIKNFDHEIVDSKFFSKIVPLDAVHQGIAVKVKPIEYIDIEDAILDIHKDNFLIAILDQITDPHNFGAILRSAYAFNVDLIVIPENSSPPENGVVAKSASGCLEKVKISKVTNLANTIKHLKVNGFWILGMDGKAKKTIYNHGMKGKLGIILGSEGKGLRRLTQENCDLLVKIPMNQDAESLNVSNAAAIVFSSIYSS